jgi:hypothetical protein
MNKEPGTTNQEPGTRNQYIVSVHMTSHSINTRCQYTVLVHSASTQYQYTVSVHSISAQYWYTLFVCFQCRVWTIHLFM